jgi:hypothetical protein
MMWRVFIAALLLLANQAQILAAPVTSLAYCEDENKSGVGTGSTKAEAQIQALKHCDSGCCEVLTTTDDKCVAWAVSKESASEGSGDSKTGAKADALKNCGDDDCEVVAAGCAD